MATRSARGRPPSASREMLQDAAFELFLEQGYAATTVEQVTRRAGVSRNTFFNYFDAKADVFWVELDSALTQLAELLAAVPDSASPLPALRVLLFDLGEGFGAGDVPFALTQHELIGSTGDLQASAVTRFMTAVRLIRRFLAERGISDARARAIAYATVGASVAAAEAWAAAGTSRGSLRSHLEPVVGPVLDGFGSAEGDARR
ncbi:TetR/AcrR family transcriptional regulator [Salinibacterium sp. SYSU T00001]|uniref:TetR/AcrR family transcriptional regulator n=1 Tax=Homoserinimonas sedimenticola TaxID=2986805 RepID=UPI0022365B20|nr:TetR/AcrR family transcriptional regulator [Salinibacterium sedimenticola]MCW4384671.1 TetR/AcrR family transcriptional regulator [Salinibacterium sedimenticola]